MNGNDQLSSYLIDTNAISKYFDEALPEGALAFLDDVLEMEQPRLSVIVRIELKVYKPMTHGRERQIQEFY